MGTDIKILSDGLIKADAGSMFGRVPKVAWRDMVITDRENRMTLGMNCLLLHTCGKNVLVDTGMGSKDPSRMEGGGTPSRLMKRLRDAGLQPRDIDAVILSHLHSDHAGGSTRLSREGRIIPTFAKARYYVQEGALAETGGWSDLDPNVAVLDERGQLEVLCGDKEVLPGVNVVETDGHTEGHQVVMFNHGGEKVAYLGDIVPTPHHVNLAAISAFDNSPQTTLAQKKDLLCRAERYGWLLVFAHGHEVRSGYLERQDAMGYLRAVEF